MFNPAIMALLPGRGRGRGSGMRGAPGAVMIPSDYGGELPTTVLFSGIPTTCPLQNLFALCEVYGNVISIKRQYNNPDNCVVRFQNGIDAKSAAHFLQGPVPFFGGEFTCKQFGGYVEKRFVTNTPESNPQDPDCREYDFTHMHHRTSPNQLMNTSRKFVPSPHVFITNLTDRISDEMLRAALVERGPEPVDLLRRTTNSAIVEMPSVAAAVELIVGSHSYCIADRFIKMMFAGMSPQATRDRITEDPAQANGGAQAPTEGDEAPAGSSEVKTEG